MFRSTVRWSSSLWFVWLVKSQLMRVGLGRLAGPLPGSSTSRCCIGSGPAGVSGTPAGSFGFFLQHWSTFQKQSGASRKVSTRSTWGRPRRRRRGECMGRAAWLSSLTKGEA